MQHGWFRQKGCHRLGLERFWQGAVLVAVMFLKWKRLHANGCLSLAEALWLWWRLSRGDSAGEI